MLSSRMRVLMGLRPDSWNEDLVKLLVGDDDGVHGKLLCLKSLEPFHLAPLTGKPDWRGVASESASGSR